MPMDKQFIKAKITKVGSAYSCRITYSYYSLYYYEVVYVLASLQEAKNKLLDDRCGGKLVIDE